MWIGTWIPRTTAHGSKMCGELKLSGLMIRCWISLEIQPFNPIWGWTVSVGRNRLKPNKRDDNVFKSTETQIINCCAWCYETFVPFPMGIQFHPHQWLAYIQFMSSFGTLWSIPFHFHSSESFSNALCLFEVEEATELSDHGKSEMKCSSRRKGVKLSTWRL